jgi:RluA family pseudouridine synthase
MPPKKISLKTTQQHQNKRLDHVLAEWLPQALKQPLSKAKVRMLIVAGAVYLNGKRVRIASKILMPNAQVDVYVDLSKLRSDSRSQDIAFEMTEGHILYEDDYLIVVNKPPGIPTQPTLDEARNNLFASVRKYLAKRSGKSITDTYLGLHHRLDRDTSGVILFTKKAEANAGVAALFSSHQAKKVYQAIASRPKSREISLEWSIKNYLGRVEKTGKKTKFGSVRSGGDYAHTDFKLLEKFGNGLWIEALLHTGRTHQIRIHLSEGEMPIFGDLTYGGRTHLDSFKIPRLMLHAGRLTFTHPILHNEITIQSPLPEDFIRCLKVLQSGGSQGS